MEDLSWLDDIETESSDMIDESSVEYAERLLDTSSYDEEQRLLIQYDINDCLFASELYEIIRKLRDAQPDRIDGGFNYNQTDIKRKLRQYEDDL